MHTEAHARTTDPSTSIEAAAAVQTSEAEQIVYQCLQRNKNGMTSHEVAEATGLPLVNVSPRFRPLANKGLIEPTGDRRTNPSGRSAIVWKVV